MSWKGLVSITDDGTEALHQFASGISGAHKLVLLVLEKHGPLTLLGITRQLRVTYEEYRYVREDILLKAIADCSQQGWIRLT